MKNRKEEIISLYLQGKTKNEIVEKTSLSLSQICKYLKGIAPKEKTGPPKNDTTEKAVVALLQDGKSPKEISNMLNITIGTVYKYSSRNNINLKTGPKRKQSTYDIIKEYSLKPKIKRIPEVSTKIPRPYRCYNLKCIEDFKLKTSEAMYWIGYFFGDGCLTNGKLIVEIKESDVYHLKGLQEFLGVTQLKLQSRTVKSTNYLKNKKIFKSYSLNVGNKLLFNFLQEEFNLLPNKTRYGGIPKNIPKTYENSFCLGLLDADGYVGFSSNQYSIGWVGHFDLIMYIRSCIKTHLNIDLPIYKHKNIFRTAAYSLEQICKIAGWLLDGYDSSLQRKREKLLNIIQRELERSETKVTKEHPIAVGSRN